MARFWKLPGVALLAGGLVAAALPWRIPRATVAGAFSGGPARVAGLRAVVAGPVFLKLLPRPRLQASRLTVASDDGAVLLDAPALKAELDIPSLLRGRWRMSAATLVEPTVTVDLDRLAARRPAPAPAAAAAADAIPAKLRLRGGVLRTRSEVGFADALLTGVDAAATWSGEGDDLVVSGTATARGVTAQFAAAVQHPASCLAPEGSTASLQFHSPLLDASAEGVVSGGSQAQFAGRVALGTGALPRLLRALDAAPAAAAGVTRAQVSGDLVAKARDVSLSGALLRLDRARFEGTLAWRRDAGRSLVAGTLATDMLDLDALAGAALDRPALDALYHRAMTRSPVGFDVDMRVSATQARVGHAALGDAALSALVRGDRLELTLDEAQAYGGTVKARALAVLGPGGIDAHAELAARSVDLRALSEGLSGRERVGGTVTARAALDGRGASLGAVVTALAGDGQVTVDGGRLAGLSLPGALRRLGRRVPVEFGGRAPPTTFDRATWDLVVRDGVVRIPDGRLVAPGVAASFSAEAALPDGRVDVRAVASEADRGGAPVSGGASVPFALSGSLVGPLTLVARGAALPLGVGP